MSYGLWLSTAGMQINDYRQSVMSNNLANANTVGFKHDLAVFTERAVESVASGRHRFSHDVLDGMTGGVFVTPTVQTFDQGDLDKTGSHLDVAIVGDGFLTVADGDETKYTRDGRLAINTEGELVLAAGEGRLRVLNEQGQPIRADLQDGGEVRITSNGQVLQDGDTLGRMDIVSFEDNSRLVKQGSNLYTNHGGEQRPSTSELRVGYLEQSTANPMNGLAKMIETSRAYELNANLISLQDQTIGQAVTSVGRIG